MPDPAGFIIMEKNISENVKIVCKVCKAVKVLKKVWIMNLNTDAAIGCMTCGASIVVGGGERDD